MCILVGSRHPPESEDTGASCCVLRVTFSNVEPTSSWFS